MLLVSYVVHLRWLLEIRSGALWFDVYDYMYKFLCNSYLRYVQRSI